MNYSIEGLAGFISGSPTAFFAIRSVVKELEAEGYVRLKETERWDVQKGGKYYVTRNGSSVIAFRVPSEGFAPVLAVASHSDSPMFRIKPRPELILQGKYTMLNTERYGGMILSTWLDRPLSVAGRVLVKTENGLEARLVDLKRTWRSFRTSRST